MAQNQSNPSKLSQAAPLSPRDRGLGWDIVKTLGISLIVAFGVRAFVAEARYIPTRSMEPTLLVHDQLLIDKLSYRFREPQRGDIVVFNAPVFFKAQGFNDSFIKRVVGLPGETVQLQAGQVVINGKILQEPYTASDRSTFVDECPPEENEIPYLSKAKTIPPQHYLVLGDNRLNSSDGRCWGLVGQEDILGQAVFRFWPFVRVGILSNSDYPSRPVRS